MRIVLAICFVVSIMVGQVLYEEYFTDGNMQLAWHPWFTDSLGLGDSMGVINDSTTPGGDDWAGIITNEYMGMAGLTYSGISTLTDYSIDAWIYTVVTAGAGGPYNGVALRMNPSNRYYYRLVSDFDSDARLRLGLVGSGGMPVALRDWGSGEIPGGVPGSSSWHKLTLTMIADSIWCYYDGNLLPGCPIINDSIAQGYFGVYTFSMEATVSTICDNIIIREAVTAVSESMDHPVIEFSITPNPFSDIVNIRWQLPNDYSAGYSKLRIFDVMGRLVKQFTTSSLQYITWDGTDEKNAALPNSIYFLELRTGDHYLTKKLLLLR